MSKGSVAGLLVLSMLAAEADARGEDGCTLLDEMVRGSVHAAATEYLQDTGSRALARAGGRRAGAVGQVHAVPFTCRAPVEVVTRAFGRALSGLGMPVAWNVPPHPGDFCWSGDLGQCYPGDAPGVRALPPERLAFVHDAWKGVRRAVTMHMPRGTAGGVASFSEASLAGELSLRLRESVEGPLHTAYPVGEMSHTR